MTRIKFKLLVILLGIVNVKSSSLFPKIQEGDPAPGRSPGPPTVTYEQSRSSTGRQTVLITTDEEKCTLQGDLVLDQKEEYVNLSLSHKYFKTDVLVPGVVYQITITKMNKALSTPINLLLTALLDQIPLGTFVESTYENNCKEWTLQTELKSVEETFNWFFSSNEQRLIGNLTLRLEYQLKSSASVHRTMLTVPISRACQLHLSNAEASLTNKEFPETKNCQIWFPNYGTHGLIIELTRLNVPCSRGYIHFSGLNISQHHFFRSHKQAHLCGKLEELPESDRKIYFPSSHTAPLMHLENNPVFSFSYHLVDYCYNVTFLTKNASFELNPTGQLQCTFKIFLPYGYRVALTLHVGDSTSTGKPSTYSNDLDRPIKKEKCDGLETQLIDVENKWSHCTRAGDAEKQIEIVSRSNKVVLQVYVSGGSGGALGLKMEYRAEPVVEIVGICEFGWVAFRQFCLTTMENVKLPWAQAEIECGRQGGHLVSVRSENAQSLIDNLIFNSPGYREHNSYWIGASDKTYEGDFRWSDGLPFSYTNWFPGWSQHSHYNRQPNDDGLSDQDCVELRRTYSLPTSTMGTVSSFMWNDRDCSTPNYFICEKLQNDEPLEDSWPLDCNRTVVLSRQHPKASVSSPGFPRQYPDNADCNTDILAPSGYRILLDFEELVLENEPSCSYDYLEIYENAPNLSTSKNATSKAAEVTLRRRLCGDWSSKLKLLRYVSASSRLRLRFSSDYSHHFGGFKARVSMENANQCTDDRLHIFNNSCYLFVSYPEVTWTTAQQICKAIKANLASVSSAEEERFITSNIRKTPEYRTSALYWLGGRINPKDSFYWSDNTRVKYLGWLPGQSHLDEINKTNESNNKCLGIQWMSSPTPMLPSGLYWKSHRCSSVGGYVCKRPNQILGTGINFNKTVNGTDGTLTTPNYPGNYYNNIDFSIKIRGPSRSRLVVEFNKIDIESQLECLYDYVMLRSVSKNSLKDEVKWCGSHDSDMRRFDFVSETNEMELKFHSDYSISGSGFSISWHAVDVSSCPAQTLTAKEGYITSPNYPNFLLSNLNCTIIIRALAGQRVWFQFDEVDFGTKNDKNEINLQLNLGENSSFFYPFSTESILTEGSFVSTKERLIVRFQTSIRPNGKGFRANYKLINTVLKEEKFIALTNDTSGFLFHLNYPDLPAKNIDFLTHLVAPLGWVISLELYHIKLSSDCPEENGKIEIFDNYSDVNTTTWKLCQEISSERLNPTSPIEIISFLNTLHLRQKSRLNGIDFNASLRVLNDNGYKKKLLKYENIVESCNPNPCLHGGKCVSKKDKKFCQCVGHFTGIFCALTKCDLEPCFFGTCELTNTTYKCHCRPGYVGHTCEHKKRPCEGNPCESRGECLERGEDFTCRCHAWWEGPRCEKRMLHIPYKPLSERMLQEPFWLGLMTVFVVMAVIGLVWCAKRHFPEKIEKLLAEESDRNRNTVSSLRSASVKDQLAAASATGGGGSVAVAPSPGPAAPRSLFGRLGIRKPSILSLTSPHASGYSPATARTFSLDDLLKPLPRCKAQPCRTFRCCCLIS